MLIWELSGAKYGTLLHCVEERRLATFYFLSFYLALNYRNLFFHSSGGQKSKDKVSAGLGPSFSKNLF